MHRNTPWPLSHTLAALACCAALAAPAGAQLRIQATSIYYGDALTYTGLGDLGGGVGHGRYQLGGCSYSYNGLDRTFCVAIGTYVELAGSVAPGATGTFLWSMSWSGDGPSPVEARPTAPGGGGLDLYYVPPATYFEVLLGNGLYATFDPGVQDTPNPAGGVLSWQAFLAPSGVCTGGPSTCAIDAVGLSTGSSISAPLAELDMQLDYPGGVLPTSTPEPASLALLAAGLAVFGAWRYRRQSRAER
ncbi:MAG: PEP-CTERM sorting domain-containing protein [Gemmatirosa sp.]|nr:PEP-CTERM sorting domain-containing protein [Gemmatirosa sp.]